MKLPMVDCRSLIEFCKAFEQHRNNRNSSGGMSDQPNSQGIHWQQGQGQGQAQGRNKKHGTHASGGSLNPLSHPFCNQAPFAAIDAMMLILVIGSLWFLTVPYFKFVYSEVAELFPVFYILLEEVIYNAPVAYAFGLILAFLIVIGMWEVIYYKSRKCGNPFCKGLKKAVEFDIQLESEECVKYLPPIAKEGFGLGVRPLELGEDHKELEAELKRMAPLNGRTVLIFRLPCGCPAGRMEVWGNKKLRRIKK